MYNILLNEKEKYPTCIVYKYAKICNKVLSSHTFSAFKISCVWFQSNANSFFVNGYSIRYVILVCLFEYMTYIYNNIHVGSHVLYMYRD